jgi:hypothetical protein
MPKRKQIIIFIIIAFLTISVAVIPDIVSDDLKTWCLQHLGPNYPRYLIGLFIVGSLVLFALSSDLSKGLFSAKGKGSIENAKIRWSKEVSQYLKSAKETLKEAQPEESIKILSNLKNAFVDEQISRLSVRLAQYRQDDRVGILTQEQRDTKFNRINKDLIDLMKAIETQLAEGEKENRQLREAFRQRYRDRLAQKMAFRQPVNLRRFASTEGTSEQVAATFIPYNSQEIKEEIGKTFQEAYGRLLIVGQPGAGKTTLLLQLADRLFDLEEDTLPVVLNLATWQSSFGKLETWLEEVMASELSTNKAGARAVLRQSNLVLLLDGLDELKEDEVINSCLAAIADYGAVGGRRFVITCRIEEYKRVKEDARVNLQIEVGPLTGEQLEAELNRMGREQPEALPLLQAIQKDQLLRQAVEMPFYFNTLQMLFAGRLPVFVSRDLTSRKEEIKQKFIEGALHGPKNEIYPPLTATNWLSFLANQMNRKNKVVFELVDLQYDWWSWPNTTLALAWMTQTLAEALLVAIGRGYVSGLIFGGVLWLCYKDIQVIVLGQVFGIIIGVFGGIIFGQKNTKLIIKTIEKNHWLSRYNLNAIKKFIIFGLVFGLLVGLIGPISTGRFNINMESLLLGMGFGVFVMITISIVGLSLESNSLLIRINTPYQRFTVSMKHFYFSILQHFLLRYQLYKKGLLPLNLVDFLNEMTTRNIMETDGATWRFRHRIIQDYFADQWVEPKKEN